MTTASKVAALLLLLLSSAGAQPSPPSSSAALPYSSAMFIIPVFVSAIFFVAFLAIYITKCIIPGSAANSRRDRVLAPSRSMPSGRGGLDLSVLDTLPAFVYSEVKELKLDKGALECAICLSEFSDEEFLRLLPVCSHVFHFVCIDLWLASNVTCPVCRTNLAKADVSSHVVDDVIENDHVAIDVGPTDLPSPSLKKVAAATRPARFRRWHTMGHPVARPEVEEGGGDDDDKYTLRLPEHVRGDIFKLRRTATSVVEVSDGEETSGRRRCRRAWSDRWTPTAFLARALTMTLVPARAAGKKDEERESEVNGQEMAENSASLECLAGSSGGGGTAAGPELNDDKNPAPERGMLHVLKTRAPVEDT